MVNRKNKVAVIGKNSAFLAVILLAFLPIIFAQKIGGANLLRRNSSFPVNGLTVFVCRQDSLLNYRIRVLSSL